MLVVDTELGVAVEVAGLENSGRSFTRKRASLALGVEQVFAKLPLPSPYTDGLPMLALWQRKVGCSVRDTFDSTGRSLCRDGFLKGIPTQGPHAELTLGGRAEET